MISQKLQPFGTTIFSEMTRLAQEHGAINLSQGFPDFEGPEEVVQAAVKALQEGHNQYARSMGLPVLVEAIAQQRKDYYGLEYDPLTQVTVFSGATEGLVSTIQGLLNPGDEVVLFEPVYDSYPACLALAGAVPKYYTLRFPEYKIDLDELEKLFNDKTKLLMLNTPHNPTGKVFSKEELEGIAKLCQKYDVLVLTDEVYEHLTYDGVQHIPMASIEGMYERTISLSSIGKTYSFTGWKIGWATGPTKLIKAAQAAHQFVTFSTATPLQIGAACALREHSGQFIVDLKREYQERRDLLMDTLQQVGLEVVAPQGAYFLLARFRQIFQGDDLAFAKYLIEKIGVAAIPPSGFYPQDKAEGQQLIRFAFCKQNSTLEAAIERLLRLKEVSRE